MKYKGIIKLIVFLAFDKAKKETLLVLKTPLSKHISSRIENDYKIYISEKTFVRYYDKFVDGKETATGVPNRRILDFLCKYIGYDNFVDFYHKIKKKYKKNNGKEEYNFWDMTHLICIRDVVISQRILTHINKKLYKFMYTISNYWKKRILNINDFYNTEKIRINTASSSFYNY